MSYRKSTDTIECVTTDEFESVLSSIDDDVYDIWYDLSELDLEQDAQDLQYDINQLVDRLKDLRNNLS